MKKIPILVLAYHEHWMIANTLYCLGGDKQFEIHFVSRNANCAFRFSPLVNSHNYYPKEASDESFLEYLELLVQKTKARVLVPTNMRGFKFILNHKDILQRFIAVVPLPESWAFEIAADKRQLGTFMINRQIPTPPTLTDLSGNLEKKLEGFPFPVLLKPTVGSSGKGVAHAPGITLFDDKQALIAFIEQHHLEKDYIIQSFIDGFVIGCNVLYQKGKLLTYTIQKSLIPVKGFAASTGIEFIENKEVIEMVDSLLSKLNWNGVANIDLIYDNRTQKVSILEVNPRFWLTINGSMAGANINFPALACRQALQLPMEQPAVYKKGRYIPLYKYVVYRLSSSKIRKVRFGWKEIDTNHYIVNLLPNTYKICNKILHKILPKRKPLDVTEWQLRYNKKLI